LGERFLFFGTGGVAQLAAAGMNVLRIAAALKVGVLPTNNRTVRRWYYYRDNNELVELSVLRHKRK